MLCLSDYVLSFLGQCVQERGTSLGIYHPQSLITKVESWVYPQVLASVALGWGPVISI